ncbi:hypothetical protein PLESTB_001033400 [Pleodorina starrii]|uniref:W2 domain-containing protein n=1 Tax=Pleodorina starrii TaxID=330485 RepID=A0A9W6F4F4_9CHLO|nr:hypothetical protein PLESTM_001824600 [Pleodorina starrii]GLC55829.1 hypothetical protein PLESTB_001033400 [Pleodorina starrii]GLC63815.1 hypothetical protein PLESTF_000086000 [Pleodorina starrii]
MGVQGLLTQLTQSARPKVVSLQNGEAEARKDNLLLVDASNVNFYLSSKVADSIDWKSPSFHAVLYREACRFYGGLQRTGLKIVLIADSATAPRHEPLYIERRRKVLVSGYVPTAEVVVLQACRDLGLELIRSVHSADELLLAWVHRHRDTLFAVLSEDSDFFVYAVPRVVQPRDVVVDARCVSLHVWSPEEAWRAWHVAAAGPAGAYMPPLLRRAQVAAVLGNDLGRDLRRRLQHRRDAAFATGFRRGVAAPISPSAAARSVVLLRGQPAHLDLSFFHNPPISLRDFDADDLTQFNAIVQEYLDQDRAARDGSGLRDLTLSEEALPWLSPAVARRLAGGAVVPGFLASLACRGLASLPLPEPYWRQLRALRRAVAAELLGDRAPGAAYEYDPTGNALIRLTGSEEPPPPPPAAAQRAKEWFRPEVYLPGVSVIANGDAAAPPQRQATLQQTVAHLQELRPELPPTLVTLYGLMLHCADSDPAAWDEQAVRAALVPGVPPRQGADAPPLVAGADGEAQDDGPAGPRTATGVAVIDVGSALNEQDWNDIDDKDVVGKVRSGGAYKLLREIQPWDQLAAVRGRSAAGAVGGNKLFALARLALVAGPGTSEWAAAQAAWSGARLKDRQQALADMWSSANRWAGGGPGGAPMRHRHQQEILDMVDNHLRGAEEGALSQAARRRLRPLHVILSTPTGSGKTFTAVMMHLHVLRDREREATRGSVGAGRGAAGGASGGCAGEDRSGHPQTILVYSVPTKQVLKRVGQECEAHGVVYWTAARDGDFYQVRRPYSIRTKRGGGSTGAGTMRQQLEENAKRGAMFDDLGGGKPDVIIADIYATAALVQTASEAPADEFYRSSNLVLYLDEPNMGIHLDREVRCVVRQIMAFAPPTTILASATLPDWDELPAWWKGSGAAGATHVVISQEPYELPTCRLSVLDEVSGQLVAVSPLELFDDATQLATTLERSPRARVLLLRYFTPEQANMLLGLAAEPPAQPAAAAAAANGVEGQAAANGDAANGEEAVEDDAWKILDQDVRGLRSELLEPELVRLAAQQPPERFEELREAWRQPPQQLPSGEMRDVLSKQGVTLVATLEPRSLALQLAGKAADPERWAREAREVRAKVREAAAAKRAADKARERAAKRGDEDGGRAGGRDDGLAGAGRVSLRPGLVVWADEADDVADDDTLVMLSKGVAYTASREVEPLVKRLYQQALLYVPERAGTRPPLHTLVVDYSAVYGTDCPAVDTIVLCADLGEQLSWEDHQQFMGRLRRDGAVVYPSLDLLRRAVLGGGPAQWAERAARRAEQQRQAVEEVLARHVAPVAAAAADAAATAADATKAAARELLRLVRPGSFSRADVGAAVLTAALRDLVAPAPPLSAGGDEAAAAAAAGALATDAKLCAAALRRLKQWGGLRPLKLLEYVKLQRPAEQRRLVSALEELCLAAAAADGGAASTARYLPCAAKLLQELANEDLVEEEGLGLWVDAAAARAGPAAAAAKPGAAAFLRAATAVRDWLKEESEEESEEEA